MLKVVEVPPHLICVEDTIVKSERKRINRQSDPKGHYDKETDHPNSNFRLSMVPKKDMASESLRHAIGGEIVWIGILLKEKMVGLFSMKNK